MRKSAENIARLFGPAWAARSDLAKIMITISSALVAAILAFSEEAFLQLSIFEFLVAIGCLAGLLITIGTAVASLYAATELSSFQARQFNRRPFLREKLASLDESSPHIQVDVDKIWRPLLEKDVQFLGGAVNRAEVFLRVAVGFFVGSLTGFVGLLVMRYSGA